MFQTPKVQHRSSPPKIAKHSSPMIRSPNIVSTCPPSVSSPTLRNAQGTYKAISTGIFIVAVYHTFI